jgi:hypothetical protein
VEGYQYSNMSYAGYPDLHYGVLLRKLPSGTGHLAIRVIDVAGNISSSEIALMNLDPSKSYFNGFEEDPGPASPWSDDSTAAGGAGTAAIQRHRQPQLAATGSWLGAFDALGGGQGGPQTAALVLKHPLPGRHRLTLKGKFQASKISLGGLGNSILPLAAYSRDGLSAAAAIRQINGIYHAGVMVQRPGQSLAGAVGKAVAPLKGWMRWRLELSRLHTRQSIAVLFVDGSEAARFHFNSLARPVETFRFGIARSSPKAAARLLADDLELGDDYGRLGGGD